MAGSGDVTQLLHAFRDGDRAAFDRLIPLVYDDLRRIARAHAARGPSGHTLQATSLVNEAYLRLVDQTQARLEDREHFFAVCACAMRQIVISNARRHAAQKRGGGAPDVTWDDGVARAPEKPEWWIELDQALDRLAERDPRLARVVEVRYFVGLTEEETAEALGQSLRTVQRDWQRARAWLRDDMRDDER